MSVRMLGAEKHFHSRVSLPLRPVQTPDAEANHPESTPQGGFEEKGEKRKNE
jgi:hypothetical protein